MNIRCIPKLIDYITLFKFIKENEAKQILDERLQNVWDVLHNSGYPYKLEPDVIEYYEKCYVQIEKAMNDQNWDYFIETILVKAYSADVVNKSYFDILNTILMHTSFKGELMAHHIFDIWEEFVINHFGKNYFECENNEVTYIRRVIAKCFLLCLRNDVPIEDFNNKYVTYTHKQLKILEKKQSLEQDFV